MATTGRPSEYTDALAKKAQKYLDGCVDSIEEYHKTRGEKSDSYERIVRVKLPTIEGLAIAIGINKTTVYEWEKKYPAFSNVIEDLRNVQADRLLNNGMSGDYNPTIAKVLLTKHGYREGTDVTSAGKQLPTPILGTEPLNVQSNDSNKKDSEAE